MKLVEYWTVCRVIVSVFFSMCACFPPQKPRMIKLTINELLICNTRRQAWHFDKKPYDSYSGVAARHTATYLLTAGYTHTHLLTNTHIRID